MTCEDIIQRLLDEKHITVKEAMIMIKELVKNSIPNVSFPGAPEKEKDFWKPNDIVVMYGITTTPPYITNEESNNNAISTDKTYPVNYCSKTTN